MRSFDATSVGLGSSCLIEASAGTGKTHAITTLVLRLLLEQDRDLEEILVVTFTEAATAELRARIRQRLRAAHDAFASAGVDPGDVEIATLVERSSDRERARARLALALGRIDDAPIHTIHGFCQRALTEHAFDSGVRLDAELITDVDAIRDEVVLDFWTASLSDASAGTVRALQQAKVTATGQSALVDKVTEAPYLRLKPEQVVEPRAPDEGAFAQLHAHAAALWDRARILELLRSPSLKRTHYPPGSVASWCDEVASFLRANPPSPLFAPRRLDKLTPAALVDGCKKGGEVPRHPFFGACDALQTEIRGFERWRDDLATWFRHRLVSHVRSELPRRKDALGVMAFGDLLLRLEASLVGPAGQRLASALRGRWTVALVDEFQDTDPLQYAIFRRVWGQGALFVIGDPKQAIYAFRGADVFAYLRAAGEVDAERRFTMDVNWRSDPALLRAVEAVFGRASAPFLLPSISFAAVRPRDGAADVLDAPAAIGSAPLQLLFVRRDRGKSMSKTVTERVPALVAAEVATLLDSDARLQGRAVEPGDVAVLTRTNAQAFAVQRELAALQVPSAVLGDLSVFDDSRPEARELQLLLSAALDPGDSAALRAALSTDTIGLTAEALLPGGEGDERLDHWTEQFRRFGDLWERRGFVRMFRAVLETAHVRARLLALSDGERRLTNLLHLGELLHTAERNEHLGPAGLLNWLARERGGSVAAARGEATQIRLESDERVVKITTVHRSKGLEYPIVFCPFLWDGKLLFDSELATPVLHDSGADDALVLALDPSADDVERARWEKLAESVRLLYVALTRARHRCVVVWGRFAPSFATSALAYLLHSQAAAGSGQGGAAPGGGQRIDTATLAGELKKRSDDEILADLENLAQASDGSVELRIVEPTRDAVPWVQDAATPPALSYRSVSTPVRPWWRTASFTELSRHAADAPPPGAGEGRDRDERTDPMVSPTLPLVDDSSPILLTEFPRGPKAGNFFHELLEHLDFGAAEPEMRLLVSAKLTDYGYPRSLADLVCGALGEVLHTPLGRSPKRPLRLCDIARAERLDELEFQLPVAAAAAARSVPRGTQLALLFPDDGTVDQALVPIGPLTAAKLSAIFSDHPSPVLAPDYAGRVAELGFLPLQGFLKGYIDMVFRHGGRWFLADYKTNHLGDRLLDYAPGRLPTAMARGHYYLQYHLYAVALHRFLGRRLSGYRYREHFGGVYYLFLKGMTPATAGRTGVFFERPPEARIEALSELLAQPLSGWRPR